MTFDENCLSIIIPTYKRPDALARALASVEAETVSSLGIEIVIADNDPKASARSFVMEKIATTDVNITYIHVPEPGVSNARNSALATARGRYILFLDDDMEASSPWAQAMVDAALKFDAALVFGPVNAVMPDPDDPFFERMQPLFSRENHGEDGIIERGIGTGNCFIDRVKAALPSPVFDTSLNQTGGEDDALFRKLEEQDIRIAWTNAAVTLEHVPAHRATMKYVWRRNFAFGQAPTHEAAEKGVSGWPLVVFWMCVGVWQIVSYGVRFAVTKLLNRPESVFNLGRLAQGFGKLFWSDRLSPKFYGI
ncbi:MAG: glycosyltransferase family 2 protein [Litorimonas sp.]